MRFDSDWQGYDPQVGQQAVLDVEVVEGEYEVNSRELIKQPVQYTRMGPCQPGDTLAGGAQALTEHVDQLQRQVGVLTGQYDQRLVAQTQCDWPFRAVLNSSSTVC